MSGFETPEGIRLQKVLSAAGVASRRVIEQYIVEGRIRVNGETVTELGRRVDPETCLLYTSPSPRDRQKSRMPSSA